MTQKERDPVAHRDRIPEVDTTGEQLDSVSVPPYLADWREQLAERVQRQQARRAAFKAVRADLAARRARGLRARHAAKLRRSSGGGGRR